jgi:hypothetical protein
MVGPQEVTDSQDGARRIEAVEGDALGAWAPDLELQLVGLEHHAAGELSREAGFEGSLGL